MNKILQIKNLGKRFGGVIVADNIEIELKKGDVLGIIGPNGAGKTSLFNLISGIYSPDIGEIYYKDILLNSVNIYKRARLGISRTWQNIRLFPSMTALDNVLLGSKIFPAESVFNLTFKHKKTCSIIDKARKHAYTLLEKMELDKVWDKPVSEFSFGMQKRLALARGLMNNGDCLLLDEPIAGVEGPAYDKIREVIHSEARSGRAILIIEHSITFLRDLCDDAIFMMNGRILKKGSMDSLLNDPRLQKMYFGLTDEVRDV